MQYLGKTRWILLPYITAAAVKKSLGIHAYLVSRSAQLRIMGFLGGCPPLGLLPWCLIGAELERVGGRACDKPCHG